MRATRTRTRCVKARHTRVSRTRRLRTTASNRDTHRRSVVASAALPQTSTRQLPTSTEAALGGAQSDAEPLRRVAAASEQDSGKFVLLRKKLVKCRLELRVSNRQGTTRIASSS